MTSFGNLGADRGGQNTTITENFFSGNLRDLLFSATQAAGTISTNKPSTTASPVPPPSSYAGTETINVSGNWWNTASNPETAGRIGGTGAANIDYTPWLNVWQRTPRQPPPASRATSRTCMWTTTSPQSTVASPAGRIQEAVNVLADGSLVGTNRIIDVEVGTYLESVLVNKSVKLLGEQAGVDAPRARCDRVDHHPAVADELTSRREHHRRQRLDGRLHGGRRRRTAGQRCSAAGTAMAHRGILPTANSTQILNNRIQNLYGRGVQFGFAVSPLGGRSTRTRSTTSGTPSRRRLTPAMRFCPSPTRASRTTTSPTRPQALRSSRFTRPTSPRFPSAETTSPRSTASR